MREILGPASIAGDCNHPIVFGSEQRHTDFGAVHFERGVRMPLEAFDQQQINVGIKFIEFFEQRFRLTVLLVKQCPMPVRDILNFLRPGFPPGSDLVVRREKIELVMGIFHCCHLTPAGGELGQQLA